MLHPYSLVYGVPCILEGEQNERPIKCHYLMMKGSLIGNLFTLESKFCKKAVLRMSLGVGAPPACCF